ncbi:MAG: ABC transporter permease subunit [Planctomycetota bacterium]|nr:ABC transporter permease subunit [Planctomycetota bacterium]
MNAIVRRELISILRTWPAAAIQVGTAVVFALLVVAQWPTGAVVDLSGVQAERVFRLFGYGLLTTLLLLVPAVPATSIVREKKQGTLTLLLNSPLTGWGIYSGKLLGVLGFVMLPLLMSLPAAAACYAMGGLALGDVLKLYAVLLLATVQCAAIGLLVSSYANSTDAALRLTYGFMLLVAVILLGPYQILQGKPWPYVADIALWLRGLSPIPAVVELLRQGDVGGQGLSAVAGNVYRYFIMGGAMTGLLAVWTARRLKQTMLDRPRPQGVMTDDRSLGQRSARRLFFLIDPQRRSRAIGRFTNPVLVKEFRSRRFGRSYWMVRLIAGCAIFSLLFSYAATTSSEDWGVETIGGILVVLQVALIVFITPSLAAGMISAEHESGGWTLLRMTPLSAGRIVTGKLLSVLWTLLLVLLATLPGYALMIVIMPKLMQQIIYVLICLVLSCVFSLVLSAMVSSFFRRTAPATITAYTVLAVIYGGTLLVWFGRDAPFGHDTVQRVLTVNTLAAAMHAIKVKGFETYELIPANWWFVGCATVACLGVFAWRVRRLTRPE